MSEPTAPDSEPTTEPDVELDAEAPKLDQAEPTPESDAAPKSTQVIAIVAAAVIVVVIGVVAAFAFLGDDDKKPVSAEDQAKAAAVAMFQGIYKVAQGNPAGCQDLVDNLALTPEQGNFLADCIAKIPTQAPAPDAVVLNSVVPTQVTLDQAAGTGTVMVDVSTTEKGKSETQPASVPVLKVDDRWKVDLNSNPTQ